MVFNLEIKGSNIKRIIAVFCTVVLCISVMGFTVYAQPEANVSSEKIVVSPTGESRKIIASFEGGTTLMRATPNLRHDYGFKYEEAGSNVLMERVWGETVEVAQISVDTYTRARYESWLTGSISGDSGRKYDSADGSVSGISRANSGWIIASDPNSWVGHTYYGYQSL